MNNISVKIKIFGMAGLLILALIISVAYALLAMNKIGGELVAIAEEDIPLTKITTEITIHQLEQGINFERALRFALVMDNDPVAAKRFNQEVNTFNTYSQKVDEEILKGEALAEQSMNAAHSEAERNEFQHISDILKKVEHEHKQFALHVEQVFALVKQGKMQAALEAAEKVEKEEQGINHELEGLLVEIENFTESAALQAEHDEQSAFITLMVISIVAIVLGVTIAIIIINGVSKGLKGAVVSARQIASGDLTHDVPTRGKDEIGLLLSALAEMRNKLHAIIMEMNHASTELAAASEELSAVSEDSNKGIHQQQTEIQQAATAMTEMTAAVQEVTRNAQLTSGSANDANNEAKGGQLEVDNTVALIQALSSVVDNANTVVAQVAQDSTNIGTVLDVIKGIAEQTNLLALNAAIEAARAGEQGRGFAVVADEVRTLAQRTQESTSEIEAMITRLQDSSGNAITAMESGQEQAASCVEQASRAGTSLHAITKVVSLISDMNAQIAAAAEEQTSVAEDVSRNVVVISQVAEQNAAATNQITASSEELSRMAVNLQQMIAQFEV